MGDIYIEGLEAFGLDMYEICAVCLTAGIVAEMNSGGKHSALLMIGVIAGKLCPTGYKYLFSHSLNPLCTYFAQSTTHIRIYQKRRKVN